VYWCFNERPQADCNTCRVAAGSDASGWQINVEVYRNGGTLHNLTRHDSVVAGPG
jgi:hypothetical protein